MNGKQTQVKNFHEKFGIPVARGHFTFNQPELRARLIDEECKETLAAIERRDLPETIDGLCDLIYVCYGAALAFGVDLEPYFNEVHKTNMAKSTDRMRADGKILKPEGWKPPRIAEMITEGRGRIK